MVICEVLCDECVCCAVVAAGCEGGRGFCEVRETAPLAERRDRSRRGTYGASEIRPSALLSGIVFQSGQRHGTCACSRNCVEGTVWQLAA